jgi:hypothetical protein
MYLKNRAFYRVEYEFVPALMNAYKKYGKLSLFNDVNVWKKNVQSWGPSIYENFDWDALQIKTYGKEGDDVIVVLYVFPEPFRSPQAAYGAIVIENDNVNYYTFELSVEGDYVLGSKSALDIHFNFGNYPAMSADKFLALICEKKNIDLPVLNSTTE